MREGVVKKTTDLIQTVTVATEQTTRGLGAEQERVLRMRAGAGLASGERLGSKLDGLPAGPKAEASARLALMEAELLSEEGDAEDDSPRAERFRRIVAALKAKAEA